jgi:segregation and condensation protein B
MPLDILIEAMLFYKAAPQKKSLLLKIFAVSEADFAEAVQLVRTRLEAGATRLVETDAELSIATAPALAEFIESLRKNELKGDIGKAGAETLAIVLYREPISRAEIDRIRGVNSSFILRNLMVKGLIERIADGNGYQFRITSNLLQTLGIEQKSQLPRFAEFMNTLDTFTNETV